MKGPSNDCGRHQPMSVSSGCQKGPTVARSRFPSPHAIVPGMHDSASIPPPPIDEHGSPVSLEPRAWLICFVPGLKRQWWHRFVHRKHKHVFAILPGGDGTWTLVELWWTRLLVATISDTQAVKFLRWAAMGDVLSVREAVPGRGSQFRGWMNCSTLTAFLLGRSYWVWSPHGLYRRLLREPGVKRVDVDAVLSVQFGAPNQYLLRSSLRLSLHETSKFDIKAALQQFGRGYLHAAVSEQHMHAYRLMLSECSYFPQTAAHYWGRRQGELMAPLIRILELAQSLALLRIDDCHQAASHFMGMLRGSLCLSVALGLRSPPSNEVIEETVVTCVDLFLGGVADPDSCIACGSQLGQAQEDERRGKEIELPLERTRRH